jgi:hypothetical protein
MRGYLELLILAHIAVMVTIGVRGLSHLWRVMHRIEARLALMYPLHPETDKMEEILKASEFVGIE